MSVVVWQKDRVYDTYCHDHLRGCVTFRNRFIEDSSAASSPGTMGERDLRSGYAITVEGMEYYPEESGVLAEELVSLIMSINPLHPAGT